MHDWVKRSRHARTAFAVRKAFRQRPGESGATSSRCIMVMTPLILALGTQEENSLEMIGGCRHERSESIMEAKNGSVPSRLVARIELRSRYAE